MDDERGLKYAQSLAELIRIETISVSGQTDLTKFHRFHDKLKEKFPNLFETVTVEEFDGSLLLHWKGRDSSKEPVLLMSHHDVVEAGGKWQHEPFSGDIADGKLWGRGTLDTKGSLWAMLQAAEELISEGFVPSTDVYFESACTEEIEGTGANVISQELQKRGIRFSLVLDEGGMILYDPIGGADGVFAMAGVGEKDYADVKFIAKSSGGHASTPGKNTPLVRLGRFMAAVEDKDPFKCKLSKTVQQMFLRMAPTMKGIMKTAFSHPKLFKGLLTKIMPNVSPTAGALLKTTIAFTMCSGSDGSNVMPQEAWVMGNIRFSHHQGKEKSLKAISKIAKKYDIEMEIVDPGFESQISSFKSKAFKLVESAVSAVFPGVKTAPYIMNGASDARFFSRVSDNCIRLAPLKISDEQLDSIHGINENVDISALAPAVDFYKYIIREV